MSVKLEKVLTRGVEAIYPSKEELLNVLKTGRKLRIYNGIDPTSPHLHLGHMVILRKLAQFQNLRHKIVLLIGDFTGMIGDPTGKLSTRTQLTHQQVLKNAKNYPAEIAKFLKFTGSNPAEIKYNSQWLSKLSAVDWFKLASQVTYQQLIERDMFQARIKQGKDIFLHEFFYPLMQAYDSVVLDVDLEIGGTDQTFNMLMGRRLAKKLKKKEKFVLTTKLLTDPTGVKMGKTAGNMINLDENPNDMFGKIMSLPDKTLPSFFELLTEVESDEISKNPLEAKKLLATEILKQLFSETEAKKAKEEFERVFQKRQTPVAAPIFKPKAKTYGITDLLVEANLAKSKSEAKRLVEQGAVDVNQAKITNPQTAVITKEGTIIRVGKYKFIQIGKQK